MTTGNPSNIAGRQVDDRYDVSKLKDVMDETVSGQVLQRLERIERTLSSMEERFGARLDEIEARLTSPKGSHKVIADKASIRNQILNMMHKGWITEDEIIAFTVKENQPWQTIGVRSFVKKLKTQLGIVVDSEDNSGVRRYRIAK